MPKINPVRRQTSGPVDFSLGDTTREVLAVERGQAQGLREFGRGLQSFGRNLSLYAQKKDNLDKETARQQSTISAAEAAQKSFNDALNNPERAADGSDLVSLAEENYSAAQAEWEDGLSPDQKKQSDLIWRKTFLNRREKLLAQQRQEHLSYTLKQGEAIKDGLNTLVANNPDGLQIANEQLRQLYENQRENSLINDAQRDQLIEDGIKGNAVAAVNSLIRQNKYDEARDRVLTGDMSSIFGVNQKGEDEKTKMVEMINRAEVIHTDGLLKEMALKEREQARMKQDQRDKAFSTMVQAVSSGELSEDDLRRKNNILLSSGITEKQDYNFIENMLGKSVGRRDDKVSFDITDDMFLGKESAQIRQDIVSRVNDKSLSADEGTTLLNRLKTLDETRKRSGKRLTDERTKNAKLYLDAAFRSKEILDKLNAPALAFKRAQAYELFFNLRQENPSARPEDLALKVIDELGGMDKVLSDDRIRGIEKQDTIPDLKQEAAKAIQKHQLGEMDDAQLNKLILQIQTRQKQLELRETILRRARGN